MSEVTPEKKFLSEVTGEGSGCVRKKLFWREGLRDRVGHLRENFSAGLVSPGRRWRGPEKKFSGGKVTVTWVGPEKSFWEVSGFAYEVSV